MIVLEPPVSLIGGSPIYHTDRKGTQNKTLSSDPNEIRVDYVRQHLLPLIENYYALSTLVQCANAAVRVKSSFFSAQYQRLSVRRGKKRAVVAIAHSILITIYHMLKDGQLFQDLGANYYNQFNKERKVNALLNKLRQLGWEQHAVIPV